MSHEKMVIDGLDGLRKLAGKTIGTSRQIEVTQEKIEQYCLSVDNHEWIHWDVERCKNSPLGNTIAPSWFTISYYTKLFFEMVELKNIPNMLAMGSDRIRLLSPLTAGTKFTLTVKVGDVEERDNGIAVHYDATWNAVGQERPICVADIIIRYMDS